MQRSVFLKWFGAGTTAAVTVGWLAAQIHASGHAPVVLTSLGVGALLGYLLIRLAAMLRIAGSRVLVLSAVLFAVVAVLGEHAWLYQDFRRQWSESRAKSAAVAMFRSEAPPSPREYFAHEWQPVLWLTDAALIVATAASIVYAGRRQNH